MHRARGPPRVRIEARLRLHYDITSGSQRPRHVPGGAATSASDGETPSLIDSLSRKGPEVPDGSKPETDGAK